MLLILGSCLLVFGTLNIKVDTYCCFSSKLAYDTTYWLYFDTNNLLPRNDHPNLLFFALYCVRYSTSEFHVVCRKAKDAFISFAKLIIQKCKKSYLNTMTVVQSIMS